VIRLASLWLPVAAYMAAIFYFNGQSSLPGGVEGIPDTALHAIGYGGLALVALRAVAGGRWAGVTLGTLAMAWAISTGYGATDEWHQMHVPGRAAELRDLRNDAAGAFLALGAAGAWGIISRRFSS
jgi:VanZ family protein